jgi:response regulator RpfG family c-di-GMP phosphodiesterase
MNKKATAADKLRINIFDMVASIGRLIYLMNPVIGEHHLQVAYLAYRLGEELNLSNERKFDLFMAGALHDIGALSLNGRSDRLEFETNNPDEHAIAGSLILDQCKPFSNISRLIKFHHVPWKNGKGAFHKGECVSTENHLIHLADRVAVQISGETPILDQVQCIRREISIQEGVLFVPEHVDAFKHMAKREYVWLH